MQVIFSVACTQLCQIVATALLHSLCSLFGYNSGPSTCSAYAMAAVQPPLFLLCLTGPCICLCRRDWNCISNGRSKHSPYRSSTHHTAYTAQLRTQCFGQSVTCQGDCCFLHTLHLCKLAISRSHDKLLLTSTLVHNFIATVAYIKQVSMAVGWEAVVTGCVMQVICHCWGDDVTPLLPAPDLITGADIVYQQEHFDALITTLQDLAAPHTLIFLAYKLRGEHSQSCAHLIMASMLQCHRLLHACSSLAPCILN